MYIQKNTKKVIKANTRKVRRAVRAAEEAEAEAVVEEEIPEEVGGVDVDPEASDLLFEAEDVAELIAEVTSEDVAVTVEDDVVTFEIGDDEYVVEAEGDEEILESTKKPLKGKNTVKANTKVVRASKKAAPKARKIVRK